MVISLPTRITIQLKRAFFQTIIFYESQNNFVVRFTYLKKRLHYLTANVRCSLYSIPERCKCVIAVIVSDECCSVTIGQ